MTTRFGTAMAVLESTTLTRNSFVTATGAASSSVMVTQ